MIQRDYILRMIREFMEILALILSGKSTSDLKAIERNLDLAAEKILSLNRKEICAADPKDLKKALIEGGSTHEFIVRAQILSRLLTESAELAEKEGRPDESRQLFLKGLTVLLDTIIGSEPVELLEFTPRIEGILDHLSPIDFPPEVLLGLMQYFEKQGDYAKAEDQLFQLCEIGNVDSGLAHLGESFYRRLQVLPNSILAGGGLPRNEVESGLEEFRSRCQVVSSVG